MGIRVHKLVGYGLDDVLADEDGELADPRINAASPLLESGHGDATTSGYFAWAAEHKDDFGGMLPGPGWFSAPLRENEPYTATVHEGGEYGLSNVLLLRPVGELSWARSDDTIDYVEESFTHDQQNRVMRLRGGIYPYSGSWMRTDTGETLTDAALMWVRMVNSDRPVSARLLDSFAQEAGFADHDEALRLAAPTVPAPIRALAAYGDLFTDATVWRQLRPMLYVFWA